MAIRVYLAIALKSEPLLLITELPLLLYRFLEADRFFEIPLCVTTELHQNMQGR